MSNNFVRVGQTYFRQDDSGQLYAVTDKDTMNSLKTGQLPYSSRGDSTGLSFASTPDTSATRSLAFGSNPPPASTSITAPQPQTQGVQEGAVDIKYEIQKKLAASLTKYAGVSNVSELEARRQSLLRQQLLSAPYSEQGESTLTGTQKLSLLRSKGEQYEPEIRSLEEQIAKARQGDEDSIQRLSQLSTIANQMGLFDDPSAAKRDTSFQEVNGRRLLVDSQTGETIKDLGVANQKTEEVIPLNGESPFTGQPNYGNLTANQKKMADSLNNLVRTLSEYKTSLNDTTNWTGSNMLGADAGVLQTKLNSIIFAAAQAEGTGALQQADREVIERIVPNPTTFSGSLNAMTKGGKEGQLLKLQDQIQKYTQNLQGYGLQPVSAGPPKAGDNPPAAPAPTQYKTGQEVTKVVDGVTMIFRINENGKAVRIK